MKGTKINSIYKHQFLSKTPLVAHSINNNTPWRSNKYEKIYWHFYNSCVHTRDALYMHIQRASLRFKKICRIMPLIRDTILITLYIYQSHWEAN